MKKLKILNALVMVLVQLPIWLYLMYQIMVKVQATELMWFLFWVSVPVSLVSSFVVELLNTQD